jgi:hypothetical protein
MQHKLLQSVGIAWTLFFSAFIIWIYATEPKHAADVATGASVVAGTYEVDRAKFDAALELFRREQYAAARDEWARADPARRDAHTQFYIAYAFYREGWGRIYNDDALFKQGLETINHAIDLASANTLKVEDAALHIQSAAELKTEIEQGLQRDWSDLNPLKVVRERK